MAIGPVQNEAAPLEPLGSSASQAKSEGAPAAPPSAVRPAERVAPPVSTSPAQSAIPQTDVTRREDSDGRSYYVVSNSLSGQEIIEVPAKAVRDVGQGIQEYLKGQESKAAAHLDTKA